VMQPVSLLASNTLPPREYPPVGQDDGKNRDGQPFSVPPAGFPGGGKDGKNDAEKDRKPDGAALAQQPEVEVVRASRILRRQPQFSLGAWENALEPAPSPTGDRLLADQEDRPPDEIESVIGEDGRIVDGGHLCGFPQQGGPRDGFSGKGQEKGDDRHGDRHSAQGGAQGFAFGAQQDGGGGEGRQRREPGQGAEGQEKHGKGKDKPGKRLGPFPGFRG